MILCYGPGRFANQFFRNMFGYYVAKKYNMGIQMPCENFSEIGLDFSNVYKCPASNTVMLENNNQCMEYLTQNKNIDYNINLDQCFCQCSEFASYILENFEPFQKHIETMNPFKDRYQNNEDIYIHYRIGDLVELNFVNPHEYYEKTLDKILNSNFENSSQDRSKLNQTSKNFKIYLSTDSPTHPLIDSLRSKYPIELITEKFFNNDKISILSQTILFASTCRHLILSLGTLSWLIGLYGFYSEKYFLNPKQVRYWHGSIFEGTQMKFSKHWHMQTVKIENFPLFCSSPYWNKDYYTLRQYDFSKEQICFIHLPRTGGTTIKKYFPSGLLFTVNRSPVTYFCPSNEYKYISVFREPVSRIWSFYHMIRRQGKNYPYKKFSSTIRNFCENCWETKNCYTRLFAGETVDHNLTDEQLFNRAKENMKNFFMILNFDFLNRDISVLENKIQQLSVKLIEQKIPHENFSHYDRRIPVNERVIIEEFNQLDIRLYKYFLSEIQ